MTARLSFLAALGVACLASSVLLIRTAPARVPSLLDSAFD